MLASGVIFDLFFEEEENMTIRTRQILLSAPLIVGLVGTSMGVSVGRAAPVAPKLTSNINIAMGSDINTLDPSVSTSYYDRQIMNNIYDKLFDLNPKGRVVPMLATGYRESKNKLVYTITLRKGVKFTDGTALNAAAVKFNLERDLQSPPRAVEMGPVSSVTTPNSTTVRITLSAPFAPLVYRLTDRAGMVVSPTAVQSEGATFATQPVGSGPFILKDRVKGDHMTLVRNPHYWRKGFPKAAQVTFKIFTDPNVQLVNLQSGQMDFIDSVTSQNVPTVLHDKALILSDKPGYAWAGFYLNTKDPALADSRVREAISLLINRVQYVKVIAGKTAVAADSPYGPGDFAYGPWDKAQPVNVKKARQLLAAAHATNVSFTFETSTSPIALQAAQLIQNYLAAGGITMKIQAEDFPTQLTNATKHNFQASAIGWSGRPDPDWNSYNFFVTGGPNNYGGYSDPIVDRYLNAGRKAKTTKIARADYQKVALQLQKDPPYVFIDHGNNSFGYTRKLKGFTYVPDGIIRAVGMYK